MASSKLMSSSSSKSRNSDLSRQRPSKPKPSQPPSSSTAAPHQTLNTFSGSYNPMSVDGLIRDVYGNTLSHADADATLLDAQIDLMDTAGLQFNTSPPPPRPKTVDEVWQEIVSGKECKEEVAEEMMTLEDFLARAGAVEEDDIKDLQMTAPPPTEAEGLSGSMFGFDQIPLSPFQSIDKVEGSAIGFGNRGVEVVGSGGRGRGKRPRAVLEPLDKAAQQRQKRMIKNRESAARSRERKQAYQAELESLAVRLEEEHDQLLKEKAERTAERYKQLMENIIPIVEKRRPPRVLRRVRSFEW